MFTVASYSRTTTPDVQVEIEYEGVTGYGEASMPPYLGQTVDTVMAFLRKVDLEQFSDPFGLEDILTKTEQQELVTEEQLREMAEKEEAERKRRAEEDALMGR